MDRSKKKSDKLMERFARKSTEAAGTSLAFCLALLAIVVWAVLGPIFKFSDTWQLVINTSTTIVTFLMVFLIQRAQNKDAHAIHLKLNELVAAMKGASARLIAVEDLNEGEIKTLKDHYKKLAELAEESGELGESHSIDEAEKRHAEKKTGNKGDGAERSKKPNGARDAMNS